MIPNRATDLSMTDALAVAAREVSRTLAVPRDVETSFTLHAPLELLARLRVAARLPASDLATTIDRLGALAEDFAAVGSPIDSPEPADFGSTADAADRLLRSIAEGDPAGADRATLWLTARLDPTELGALLASPTLRLQTAAGHTPILWSQWPPVHERWALDGAMIRGLTRSLAAGPLPPIPRLAHPPADAEPETNRSALADRLRSITTVGTPEFGIAAMVRQAIEHDLATPLLPHAVAGADHAFAAACRVAAESMLQDDPLAAPYGWTHALTLPLALWQLADHGADRAAAVDVALTYAAAFRGALAMRPIEPYRPVPSAPAGDGDRRRSLAAAAAAAEDAHLVKYTVACFDASDRDPAATDLYLDAAEHLHGVWRAHLGADAPSPHSAEGSTSDSTRDRIASASRSAPSSPR